LKELPADLARELGSLLAVSVIEKNIGCLAAGAAEWDSIPEKSRPGILPGHKGLAGLFS